MSYKITIFHDTDAESPRESCDNLGHMVCWHRRSNLGDETVNPEEYGAEPESVLPNAKGLIYLPLYLYEHGEQTMNTSGFSCGWDSGQVGWIYATPEHVRKHMQWKNITEARREHVLKCLRAEVEEYSQYLMGHTYGFKIENEQHCGHCGQTINSDDVESCWGFIGDDIESNGILDCVPEELYEMARVAMQNINY